ncbi:TPA: hypothetical protein ACOG4O_001810 [Staphylococcus aureus]|nr:hypothetical protein [Staphylococcus aureus]MBX8031770.1 hypothetical protein [Staphylococcus aureus]MBX8254106.1 hypothetical protein [Staphylococcus aureus]HCX8613911.1 hypothetical protein [Staphylococcus aureus]HDB2048860.1 hypothetical protein [Staphylococcus aureus]
MDNVQKSYTPYTSYQHVYNFAKSMFLRLIHQSTAPTTITKNLKPI